MLSAFSSGQKGLLTSGFPSSPSKNVTASAGFYASAALSDSSPQSLAVHGPPSTASSAATPSAVTASIDLRSFTNMTSPSVNTAAGTRATDYVPERPSGDAGIPAESPGDAALPGRP